MRVAVIDKKDITIKAERSSLKFDGETLPFGLMDILVINHSIFRNKILKKEDFSYRGGGVYLTFEGRKKVWKEFVDLVEILTPKLRKEIAHIRSIVEERG